jgi:2-phosphosulfolactate phosphatase
MIEDIFSQAPYRCRLDWGIIGTERAMKRGDIIVIVDTLSFSTTTAYAVSRGALIYPCSPSDDVREFARRIGGETAVHRTEVPHSGRFSLSPLTFSTVNEGEKIVLPSLNGSACSNRDKETSHVLVGTLVNATGVGSAISRLLEDGNNAVTVIACGEREKLPQPTGDLRPAIEDWLGAGAIIDRLKVSKSPEARIAEAAFVGSAREIEALVWDCVSGRELRADGFGEDVKFATGLDSIDTVPVLRNGAFVRF